MVQDFVDAAYRWAVGSADQAKALAWLLLAAAIAGAALWLAFDRLYQGDKPEWHSRLAGWLRASASTVGLLLTTVILCGVLVQAHKTVDVRRSTLEQASTSRRKEPRLSGIVQYAPSVAIIQLRTYTRTLIVPPNLVDRIGSDGVQVLSPYLSDPTTDDVLKLVDTFKRSGRDVVFTRQLERKSDFPVAADSADVKANIESQGSPRGQTHYEVTFAGTYQFHNPNSAPATMRFNFPPPQGGGTIQGFYFDVDGHRVTEPDEHGLYIWSGIVQPGGRVSATAHYRVTGGGDYIYTLGSENRRIGDFHMTATSNRELKFGRAGIYPSALTSNGAEWRLRDVLTSQNIDMQISRSNIGAELFDKTLSIQPLVLVLFAGIAWWLFPRRALAATVAVAAGLLVMPVLSGYIPLLAAALAGACVAAVSGGSAAATRQGWVLSIGAALLTCAFATPDNGALIGFVVLAVTAVALARMPRRG